LCTDQARTDNGDKALSWQRAGSQLEMAWATIYLRRSVREPRHATLMYYYPASDPLLRGIGRSRLVSSSGSPLGIRHSTEPVKSTYLQVWWDIGGNPHPRFEVLLFFAILSTHGIPSLSGWNRLAPHTVLSYHSKGDFWYAALDGQSTSQPANRPTGQSAMQSRACASCVFISIQPATCIQINSRS
jgi:hypothetical protein